jgi:23S rRNA pseudouridine1911/1915/1917 synthase
MAPAQTFYAYPEHAGQRLDHFLVAQLPDVSRARLQELITSGAVLVNGAAVKPSLKLRGGETIELSGASTRAPVRAIAEDIPLDLVYEDDDLAVVNKPAGMMVHAGAGATDSARNRGTLVNALLHHLRTLSQVGGELRPGIVHRLDKDTSGLIVVAKNDFAHNRLSQQFSRREVHKRYIALVHGSLKQERGTIRSSISRDLVRRTRMTTRRVGGREAVTHYRVTERLDTRFGKFSLLDLKIDTGRTHQIRVHLSSLGHPVVGDALYGAPREIVGRDAAATNTAARPTARLERNFLHATAIEFLHPRSGASLSFSRPLPPELLSFLDTLRSPEVGGVQL